FNMDPYQLSNPDLITDRADPIRYTRGSDTARIYLEGSADERSYELKLVIRPLEQHRNQLGQLLAIGLGTLSPESGEVNLAGLQWYLRRTCDELQASLRQRLQDALKMPIEQFVVLTRFLLLNNYTGADRLDIEALTLPLSGEPLMLQ